MKARKIHRLLVPIAAAPLLLTALTGSIYSGLLEQGIDAFWLLKIHSGRFGPLNLQPYYSVLLGLLTLVAHLFWGFIVATPAESQGLNESFA